MFYLRFLRHFPSIVVGFQVVLLLLLMIFFIRMEWLLQDLHITVLVLWGDVVP